MSRFITFILLLVVVVVCVGFFRGWFSLSTEKQPFSEKLDIHFQVDRDKMKQDASTVEQKTKTMFSTEKE